MGAWIYMRLNEPNYNMAYEAQQKLMLVDGIPLAQPPYNMGNMLWGLKMHRLGFSLPECLLGAHAYTIYGGMTGKYPKIELDSFDDQCSIILRFCYGQAFKNIYIVYIVFLCGSCGKKNDTKDCIQEVSARISPILDTISLDYAQYVDHVFINYTRENIVFCITRFSPDTLLRYDITVESNLTTGRVEKVNIPWSMSREKEEVIRCAAMNDIGDIEQMLKQMIRFRETIGSSHIYYFNGAINGNKVSKFDFKVAFNDKEGWQYYLLTHVRDEDDIPAEKIRVTERWCIEEIDPPDHR